MFTSSSVKSEAGNMTATQQLEFTQAMQDFKTMFPGMEDAVIEAVLRSNQGAVDATIDQLLAMNTDYENEQLRHELDEADGPSKTPDLIQSVSAAGIFDGAAGCMEPDYIPRLPRSPIHSGNPPLRELKGWDPPMLGSLPDDFLRLTPSHSRQQTMMLSQQILQARYAENQRVRGFLGDSAADPDLDQFLEDERIALFLQNEEFMAELRWNKDFLHALEKEQAAESPPNELPYKSSGGLHDDDLFRERLRNMGKMSRKKFAQLARMFTGRKKRSAKQILGHGAAPSKDSLLLNSEPLLNAEEEDTDAESGQEQAAGESSRDRK